MGLFSMMVRDAIRTSDRNKAARLRARQYPATTRLAAIKKAEREQKAREELARRGIRF